MSGKRIFGPAPMRVFLDGSFFVGEVEEEDRDRTRLLRLQVRSRYASKPVYLPVIKIDPALKGHSFVGLVALFEEPRKWISLRLEKKAENLTRKIVKIYKPKNPDTVPRKYIAVFMTYEGKSTRRGAVREMTIERHAEKPILLVNDIYPSRSGYHWLGVIFYIGKPPLVLTEYYCTHNGNEYKRRIIYTLEGVREETIYEYTPPPRLKRLERLAKKLFIYDPDRALKILEMVAKHREETIRKQLAKRGEQQ